MPNKSVRAAAEGMPKNLSTTDRLDLCDRLQTAKEYATIIAMAAHSIGDRRQMNAIARASYDLFDMIEEVQRDLEGASK
ncbi:MAG: hypothetical protein KF810_17335 [Rhizobiaceae bacterium]|nr:hypothetical protein [Rhizobiaceae bacterium]